MPHVLEPASSGRAKCRGCDQRLPKDELRFGEEVPNPFAEGTTTTHWYHPRCAAWKRPESVLAFLDDHEDAPEAGELARIARDGAAHKRIARVDRVGRSPNGRATCRHCRELIEKDTWRIGLVYFDSGHLNPAGYIHAGCATAYLGSGDIRERVAHFNPELSDGDLNEIEALAAG